MTVGCDDKIWHLATWIDCVLQYSVNIPAIRCVGIFGGIVIGILDRRCTTSVAENNGGVK